MSIRKRVLKNGSASWGYYFDLPGSTREARRKVQQWGFTTRKEAVEAEASRRIEEARAARFVPQGVGQAPPKTVGDLMGEFLTEYADRNLASKTAERYHELADYLDLGLTLLSFADATGLHFTREWNRLRES